MTSDGFKTTLFPVASARAIFQMLTFCEGEIRSSVELNLNRDRSLRGKFHGAIAPYWKYRYMMFDASDDRVLTTNPLGA